MESTTPHRPASIKAPRLAWWVATGFGSGYLRPAPGTWGSLVGLAAWALLARLCGPWPLVAAPAALTLIAVWASQRVVDETGEGDPSFIVIDEWAGIWFALLPLALIPPTFHGGIWALRLAPPFLLFRLFDIWKPGPVDAAQRLPGGWGVVLDDVVAGLMAALLTWPLDHWLLTRFPGA
jgi:phosphatidylglycerophosphatase A